LWGECPVSFFFKPVAERGLAKERKGKRLVFYHLSFVELSGGNRRREGGWNQEIEFGVEQQFLVFPEKKLFSKEGKSPTFSPSFADPPLWKDFSGALVAQLGLFPPTVFRTGFQRTEPRRSQFNLCGMPILCCLFVLFLENILPVSKSPTLFREEPEPGSPPKVFRGCQNACHACGRVEGFYVRRNTSPPKQPCAHVLQTPSAGLEPATTRLRVLRSTD